MKETPFDVSLNVIVVEAQVWGKLGDAPLKLLLDTGSSHTVILPDVMDELGFNPRDGTVITGVYSAIGKEQGYLIKVPQFSTLGFTLSDFPIHVFDLADHYGIDGLIGLSFLRRYNYMVRSAEGRILVEKIAN
jgi:predicted aspartyl protease